MKNIEKSQCQLEILIATTHRSSLDFVYHIFQNNDVNKYQILIINQTTKDALLTSNTNNIRIINSFEKGLSKSRNLAIENAVGKFCLFADDDVIYVKNFEKYILNSYESYKNAAVISFQTRTTEGSAYSSYPSKVVSLDGFYRKVLSIEITFNREEIIKNNIQFNEYFGLGGVFEDGENVFFFKDVFKEKLATYFVPETIVIHPPVSSSDDIVSDRFIFARSAMNYKLHGKYAYFYVIKLVFALFRRRLIAFKDLKYKFNVGIKGIEKYKQLHDN